MTASRPEPPPVPAGEPVTPSLLRWLDGQGLAAAAALVRERPLLCWDAFGQPLHLYDGRNAVEDCRQELGDALQYAWRARMLGEDLGALRGPAQALVRMLFDHEEET